ncbi:MAG: hypothetical protein H7X94_00370 [Vallitaleaceae bacterium]|nr:hypothetical protein [Vallitaleaceae bacterium]
MKKAIEVAAYYFPNYHIDPQNEKRYGEKWTEWELLKQHPVIEEDQKYLKP